MRPRATLHQVLADPLLEPPSRRRGGFTLVELLVVIGIIALLIGILLPTLNQVRRAAKVTACLSNIRQLNTATQQYVNDNRYFLPEAAYSNGDDADSPAVHGLPAWSPIGYPYSSRTTYVLPPIALALEAQLEDNDDFWICPSAGWEADGEAEGYARFGDGWRGHTSTDFWRPTYFYMNTKNFSFWYDFTGAPAVGDPWGWRPGDWAVRNVAGLPVTRAGKTITDQGSSEVVLWLEYKSYYHSEQDGDVYAMTDGRTSEFTANYAFLDGHAEARQYETLDGYFQQLHEPIAQEWYGINWAAQWPGLYHPYLARYPDAQ